MSKLCQLEELYLQDSDIFQYFEGQNQTTKDQSIPTLIPWFPVSLKRLHVLGASGDDQTRASSRTLVKHLALFANNYMAPLEKLSVTTAGNAAGQFFEPLAVLLTRSQTIEDFHWPGLRSLTLACSLLRPGAAHSAINRVLHGAGMAALHMPGLRRLQVFSRDRKVPEEVDGFFQYFVDGQMSDDTAVCFGECSQIQYIIRNCRESNANGQHES